VIGTIAAAASIAAAFVLVNVPGGTTLTFAVLIGMLMGLGTAAWLRARPGWMAVAAVIATFGALVASPFSITRQQLSALNRAARGGDEAAAALIALYETLEPNAILLLVAVIAAIAALFVVAAARANDGAHHYLLAESEAIAALTRRFGFLAAFLYLPMIIIIVYDVLQRKYLDFDPGFTATAWYRVFTSTKLQEMEWHLHAVLFLMCFAFAYVRDAHVRIEILRERMMPRRRVWIELLGCLLFLIPYCYVVVLYGFDFAQKSFAIMERSASQTGLGMRFIIKSFLPIGFLLLALAGVSVALKCVVYLFGPQSLRRASGYYAGTHHADLATSEASAPIEPQS
jgi:TRAP-type mannitol/chloroaromatic compound transport system permease small subunit